MDYELIRDFEILAEKQSYKEAARELGITPAALSARMKALEKSIGQDLVTHRSSSFSLTPNGLLFLEDARAINQEYTQALYRARRVSDPDEPCHLSIAVCGSGMPPRLESVLRRMYSQFPNLSITITDDSVSPLEESIQSGSVDLYFSYMHLSWRLPGLMRHQLFTSPLCVLLPSDHSLANRRSIRLDELNRETFCIYPELPNPAIHRLEKQILEQSGISYETTGEGCTRTFYQHLVGAGCGVCLCPWVLRDHIPPGVTAVPLSDPYAYAMYMIYSPDNRSPLLHTLINYMKKESF